ncbi:MAG: class I SAM-dependent methyltransferase [Deltaproteobacteria bacterium]|nr:class I SAM-dependent methyltransferase [Deltaproteobacteria bacterium]
MLSYVYMKILESRPRRYDAGIAWLSLGQADRVKREIVERYVRDGTRLLDIGAGTGTLAFMAAARGAEVTGIDVSAPMLAEAERKRSASPAGDRVTLVEAGVAEMDAALAGRTFDVVTASLVFSELSGDEQRYALAQVESLLAPGGRLVIVDETKPSGAARRALYHLVRLPLALVTFSLTQTSTRAVEGLEEKVREAGFEIEEVQRRSMGSLVVLAARKADQ